MRYIINAEAIAQEIVDVLTDPMEGHGLHDVGVYAKVHPSGWAAPVCDFTCNARLYAETIIARLDSYADLALGQRDDGSDVYPGDDDVDEVDVHELTDFVLELTTQEFWEGFDFCDGDAGWFKLVGGDSTLVGWGMPEDADAYCDHLNERRETDLYRPVEVPQTELSDEQRENPDIGDFGDELRKIESDIP